MTLSRTALLLTLLIPLATSSPSSAEGVEAVSPETPVPEPRSFVSDHEGVFGGETVAYRTIAGETLLSGEDGSPTASLFSTTYLRRDVSDPATRPVTFVFNGGPGSASVWLHMGVFGPRRAQVASGADEDDGAAPYPLVDNPHCLIDVTDLVFIDPVGTGFSRVVGTGEGEDYWSLDGDAASIAQFIRLWITEHQRWNAPKYIAGESFGTTRAAAVTRELTGDGQNVALNGLILISQALDYTGSTPVHDNLVSYITYLPTMAATARYHGRAGEGRTLEEFVQAARDFATDVYAPALLKGNTLGDADRAAVVDGLVEFTGLDAAYIERSDLRVLLPRFAKELLRDEGRAVGRLDGRYTVDEIDDSAERPAGDAASSSISSAYTASLNHYFQTELEIEMDRPYKTSNREIGRNWTWKPEGAGGGWEPSYVNTARRLSEALRRNVDLHVLVANGYYDMITPFFDAEYTFARHGMLKDRIEMTYYEAGHMMYVHEPSLDKLVADVRRFLAARD